MIRVAYVIDHLRVGGAQRHLIEVVRGLRRSGYAPELWSAAADPGELAAVFEAEGVPVRTFGLRSTMLHPRTLKAAARVARDLHRRGVHVVHGYLFEGNVLAALVGRLGRVPVTLVGKRSLDRYSRLDRRLAAWLSNVLADRVLVNAEAVRDLVVEHEWCRRDRTTLIPNGVRLPETVPAREERATEDGPVVGMVGRLGWKKAYPDALRAAAILRERVPGVRFEIVGDGPLRASLEAEARAAGLGETVRFLGQRSDAMDLMRGFDCFLLSSVVEGMPNVLLEAMALGRPVVTTSAGGSAEVVIDGESGLVVPPGDPARLAAAVERILRDRSLAERLGAAAGRRAREHFSLDAMLESLDRLYRSELARAGVTQAAADVTARPASEPVGRPSAG